MPSWGEHQARVAGRLNRWTRSSWQNSNIRSRHMRGSHVDRQPRKNTKTLSMNARRKLGKPKPVWYGIWLGTWRTTRRASARRSTTKGRLGKNVGSLMNGAENMVTRDRENADMFNGIFALDLSSKIWLWHSQVPETYGKVRHDLPLEQVN